MKQGVKKHLVILGLARTAKDVLKYVLQSMSVQRHFFAQESEKELEHKRRDINVNIQNIAEKQAYEKEAYFTQNSNLIDYSKDDHILKQERMFILPDPLGIMGEVTFNKIIAVDDNLNSCNNLVQDQMFANYIEYGWLEVVHVAKFTELENIAALFVSPGVPAQKQSIHPIIAFARKNDILIFSDIDFFYAVKPLDIYIGLTGTNGKSTTCSLIHHVLKSDNHIDVMMPQQKMQEDTTMHKAIDGVDLNDSDENDVNDQCASYNKSHKKELNHTNLLKDTKLAQNSLMPIRSSMGNWYEANLVGNIGVPIFSVFQSEQNHDMNNVFMNFQKQKLEDYRQDYRSDCYICELSSYQLDLAKKIALDMAICVEVGPDHLDRYGNYEEYACSKSQIFKLVKKTGWVIIDIDSNYSELFYLLLKHKALNLENDVEDIAILREKYAQWCEFDIFARIYDNIPKLSFSHILAITKKSEVNNEFIGIQLDCINLKFKFKSDKLLQNSSENRAWYGADFDLDIPIELGTYFGAIYNLKNMAIALASVLISMPNVEHNLMSIVQLMLGYKGLEHRSQLIHKWGNAIFINDSKATNCHASAAALDTYGDIHWIVGGFYKDDNFLSLQKFFSKIKCAYLIGDASEEFAKIFAQNQVSYIKCDNLSNAIREIREKLSIMEKATVLLSPACASTDQWADFEKRGSAFVELVLKTFN